VYSDDEDCLIINFFRMLCNHYTFWWRVKRRTVH